jgi:hypothetical protein
VKTLAFITGTIAMAAIAVLWFPGSWPAVAVGWTLYLVMAIVSTAWYTGLLILAVFSIWWVLAQPALPRRRPVTGGLYRLQSAAGRLDASRCTSRTGED